MNAVRPPFSPEVPVLLQKHVDSHYMNPPAFDADDVNYFVLNISEAQLRQNIHKADIDEVVANAYIKTEYEELIDRFPHDDYRKASKLALDILCSMKPKPKLIPGKIDIEQVKAGVDIVDVIGRYTRLRKQGRNFLGCCPIHGEEHPSLTVYPEQQSWYCFGCHRGGAVIDFVMAVEKLDFKEAIATLAGGG